ncbi:MAG: hypothetical protein A2Z99_18845 [Treponema sp. GWB1_62_6]|nr:MAG: hypothetical protein A2Z99_18845 [Treponema sp. GWB1_62_6]OHE75839.1 MAG: hypothetical protein A2413_11465 [Treponema sp. RIFOXYC1_FULL_61_9]HCM28086.1 hypothetical protein [Treponema sp.]
MIQVHSASRSAVLGAAFLFMTLSSCSARIGATLRADGSAEATISASVAQRTAALIRNLSGLSGASRPGSVLDAAVLSGSLRNSPAVRSAAFRNIDDRSVSGTLAIADFRLLAAGSPAGGGDPEPFIRVEKTGPGGTVFVHLDRKTAPAVLDSLSPEIGAYLEALMAPVVTGEDLTESEYLEFVAAVYGNAVSAEIAAASLTLTLNLPGPAIAVLGGTLSDGAAEYSIPLVQLLVLENPADLAATWN